MLSNVCIVLPSANVCHVYVLVSHWHFQTRVPLGTHQLSTSFASYGDRRSSSDCSLQWATVKQSSAPIVDIRPAAPPPSKAASQPLYARSPVGCRRWRENRQTYGNYSAAAGIFLILQTQPYEYLRSWPEIVKSITPYHWQLRAPRRYSLTHWP